MRYSEGILGVLGNATQIVTAVNQDEVGGANVIP
jgi:hypothetical protein